MAETKTQETPAPILQKPVKKRHPLVRLFFTVGFVFIIAEVILLFFATPMLRQALSNMIETRSEGLYSITFDSLSVDLGARGFIFFGLELKPDTFVYNQLKQDNKVKRALYEFHFKSFKVSNLKLWRLYKNHQLDLNQLVIDEPDIILVGLPFGAKDDEKKYQAVQKDLYPALLDALQYIKARKIKILNGSFNFWISDGAEEETSVAENLSFELNNFYLDAKTFIAGNNLFYAERTLIQVQDYSLKLKDHIHTVKAREIVIDTKLKQLRAYQIQLYPGQLSDVQMISNEIPYVDIELPMLSINGLDINKTINTKEIDIRDLQLREPSIYIFSEKNDSAGTKINYNLNFYPLIDGMLQSIKIQNFILEKARLIVRPIKMNIELLKLPSINVKLKDFLLDKKSYQKLNRTFGAKEIEVDANHLQLVLADNKHLLKLDSIYFSTLSQTLRLNKLSITNRFSYSKTKLNIQVPELNISKINILQLIHKKLLPMGKLSLKKASFEIFTEDNSSSKKLKQNTEWKQILFFYLQNLKIDELSLSDIEFDISQKTENDTNRLHSHLNMQVYNLNINPQLIKQPDKFFYSDSLHLLLNQFSIKLNSEIKFDTLLASSADSMFELSGFEFIPLKQNQNKNLYFKLPKLIVHNANFNKSLFHRHLFLDSIVLIEPQIAFTQKAIETRKDSTFRHNKPERKQRRVQKFSGTNDSLIMRDLPFLKELSVWIDSATIRSIHVLKGDLNISIQKKENKSPISFRNSISVALNNFHFNMNMNVDSARQSSRIMFSDKFTVDLYNYRLQLPDGIHILHIDTLSAETHLNKLYLKNISITKAKQKKENEAIKKWNEISFPMMQFRNINFHDFLMEKKLMADTLIIHSGQIKLYNTKDPSEKILAQRIPWEKMKLPPNIHKVNIKTIMLDSSTFLIKQSPASPASLKAIVYGQINSFKMDSLWSRQTSFQVPASDVAMEFKDFRFNFPDSVQHLTIDQIKYSAAKQTLNIENLLLTYDIDCSEESYMRQQKHPSLLFLEIPRFTAQGLDINKLLQRELIIQSAEISYPGIHAFSLQDSALTDISKNNWYKKIVPFFDKVLVNDLDFYGAELNTRQIFYHDSLKNLQLFLSGTLYEFLIDSNHQIKIPKDFYKEKANVSIHDFQLATKDSIYALKIKTINADTRDSSVVIKNLSFVPYQSENEFIQQRQSSYIALDSVFFKAEKVDFTKFFERKYIYAKTAILANFNLRVVADDNFVPNGKKEGKLLLDMLQQFPYLLALEKLSLSNGGVKYLLTTENGKTPGYLELNRFSGTIERLSNFKQMYPYYKSTTMDLNCNLYENTNINIKLSQQLNKPNDDFKLAISINNFALTDLNQFIEETYNFSIRSGFSENTRFFVEGDNKELSGNLRMRYKNLKVDILKTKKENQRRRGFTSYLANTIIRQNNPHHGSFILKEGAIYLKRDSSFMFLSYWINGMVEGVKSTLGFRSKEVKEYQKLLRVLEKAKLKSLRGSEKKKGAQSIYLPQMPVEKSIFWPQAGLDAIVSYSPDQINTCLLWP